MQISFWGVRGSAPAPHRDACRYGGNTPCLEIRAGNQLFILDAGTGLADLGRQLQAEPPIPALAAHLLLTHYHWDHVQGLPFFEPFFATGNRIRLFGPRPPNRSAGGLRGVVETLLGPPFCSEPARQLEAACSFEELDGASELSLGDVRLRTCRTHHPQGALAYRLEHDGLAVVYAPDHAPGNPEIDLGLRQLARGAHLLIGDAHYLPGELVAPAPGHGTWEAATTLARDAGVKNLVLFHHHPLRTDAELDHVVAVARRLFPRTWAAQEGMQFELTAAGMDLWARRGRLSQRVPLPLLVQVEAQEAGEPVRHDARLENLSFHGAYFLSARPYELQQTLELIVSLPSNGTGESAAEPPQVRLRGNVMRVEPLSTNGGWIGVGVSFAEPASVDAVPTSTNGDASSHD